VNRLGANPHAPTGANSSKEPPVSDKPAGLIATAPRETIGAQVGEMHIQALPHVRVGRPPLGAAADVWLRVRVGWKASNLDRQLAEGLDPARSPELSVRARQLTSERRRADFAQELESLVRDVHSSWRPALEAVPLQRTAIAASAGDLLDLATVLRSQARCRPHAAGTVSFLLRDAASPLYYTDARATPADLARAAIAGFTQAQ
jgi:hypothetical protein